MQTYQTDLDIGFTGFDDFHLHLNSSSSILKELASLVPPSPILEPSDLSESCTSADIPIILFESPCNGIDVDPFGTPTIPLDIDLDVCLDTSESVQTIASVGTFGPRRHASRPPPILSNLPILRNSQASSFYSPPISPVDTIASDRDEDTSSVSEMSVASFHTALSTACSQSSFSSIDGHPRAAFPEKPRSLILNKHPSQLFSGNPSPLSSSFPSSNSNNSNHSTIPVLRHLTAILVAVRLLPTTATDSLCTPIPLFRLLMTFNEDYANLQDFVPSIPRSDLLATRRALDGLILKTEPSTVAWRNSCQEKQTFHFHYALFDGLPILRRVTVNDDESHDYISRQASLSLKSNGVYTIRGTETSILDPKSASAPDGVKLRWKFDYMVDDRRAEGTGKILEGEKTLTPLTFSCSPLLLHAQQGKKIRLMHIVKKSVVSKLMAEKVEPPRARSISPHSSPVFQVSPKKPHASSVPSAKNHPAIARVWNIHRRAHSHVPSPEAHDHKRMRGPSRSSIASEMVDYMSVGSQPDDSSTLSARRRRASSAGEKARERPSSFGLALTNILAADDLLSPPRSPFIKHIISPSPFVMSE
ncbi:hypothetical protein CPB85DRAFT_1247133 [Mucidula mucida]|nr:hypothetical protein CPB85DRAFT_1247133 [Mucidula mucida]